ncbi:hypothetical protein PLESTB_000191300 [Pleodorina starrii]|uniref:Response regulatory domain-containing protein n=1 Tax=Pleodorina starrii TaxID=330485 RepID=A0A9W6EXX9_9CHLO|nr:hypothetical protein PLESTM_000339600 [Pleodorina starrii]GLC49182.1 hypothetical protein PLESTB_000191300 [Pleodorina starrii]GLC73561.1 hypothetical protein PLESTF_001391400 [Pleodorina starrii]
MAVEFANMRQLPGLSHRPNFPRDLHVLLLDPDFKARQEAESQLRENHYAVTPCSCSVEAAAFLANPENSCDVLLADVRCLQQKSAEHTAVVQAAKTIPLVLMSESSAPNEVMLGIKLGAVDFLEKPLSPLKLKNIWQHSVRRMLSASQAAPTQLKKGTAASGTASPEDSGCQGGGPATHSHGSGGESGSNASTSDQAPVKVEYDADMETSSLHDAMGCIDAFAVGGAGTMTTAAAHLVSSGGAATLPGGVGAPVAACGAAGSDPMQLDGGCAAGAGKPRPQPLKYKASRGATVHGHVSDGSGSSGPKPAIGYPAGQMPPLPAGIPGIEWGLPTNPLQISPKAPAMPGLMGPMAWPGSPFFSGPAALFPAMMMCGSPSPSVTSAGGGCCGTMPLSSSCLTLSSATNASLCHQTMKRAESAPLPAVSSPSRASDATTMTGMTGVEGFLQPPVTRVGAVGVSGLVTMSKADLFLGLETGKSLLAPPPIGLNLKKSPSLADFISASLGDGSPAC